MSNLLRKLAFSFLAFLVLFFSVAPNFMAAKAAPPPPTWYNQNFFDWYAKVYSQSNPSEIFGERYTAAQVQWVVYGLLSLPLNFDPDTQKVVACFFSLVSSSTDETICGQALLDRFQQFNSYFTGLKPTASNGQGSLRAAVFNYKNRPISGIGYTANLINNLSPVKSAYAQGVGYTALNPIQKYWSGFRNVAYALIVLVIVIFAFMIMFRVKISPQLVISVQSALPKVVVALLLTTFSYAISGFMIDLMYLIGGIFAMLIAAAGFDPAGAQHTYSVIFPSNATGLYFLTHMIVFDIFFLLSVILNFVASAVSVVAILPSAIFAIIGILLVVWILVLSVWYTFKATWVLLKTLISVYVQIITSPLQFVLAPLVPGFGFGNWFKRLLSDLLVFPVTGVVMFFAWALMWTSYKFAWSSFLTQNILSQIIALITGWMGADTSWFNTIWTPEILGFGKAISGFLFLMASFSLIALIPKVPDMLKGLIMGEKFSFGNAIGEAVGPLNWAYGASGAKGSIDLARRSLEQQRLIRSMKNIEEEQGAIGSFVANLSRSRVGKAIGAGGIVRDVKEGATRH